MEHVETAGTPAERRRDDGVVRFLERFVRFGAEPSVATYMPLFHREATLFDDGMERPISYGEIPASIEATLALAQGFVMVPERWRERGGVVFVEARNEATILGARAAWRSVYRVELEGDLVRRGRRFYDRAPLLAALDPTLPRLEVFGVRDAGGEAGALAEPPAPPCGDPGATVEELVRLTMRCRREASYAELAALLRDDAVLIAPGAPRPLARDEAASYWAGLQAILRGAVASPRAFAGDEALLFVEWEASVPTACGGYAFAMVERFDLVGGRILAARGYFDAAALARALAEG
jgi:hypothetical protein